MLTRILSDFHNDACERDVITCPQDSETTLVLAGDIDMAKSTERYGAFLERHSKRFKYIVIVCGNHEYWGTSILQGIQKMKDMIKDRGLTNVFHLENETVVLDGVAFIGATLWTYMRNPLTIIQAQNGMSDYRRIRIGPTNEPWKRKFTVADGVARHIQSRNYIFEEIKAQKAQGRKVFVVTHHAPSARSLSPKFPGDPLNPAYYSDLDMEIMDAAPDYWAHGHVHWAHEYKIGDCTVVCNPRGYESYHGVEFTSYDPRKTYEV